MDGLVDMFGRTHMAQRTLQAPVECAGIGVHSGQNVRLRLLPAELNCGIVFVRTDLGSRHPVIPALWTHVTDTTLCTVISDGAGATIGTVEHLMAALRGCGVDNAIIEVHGPEVPIMDGSAEPFVRLIDGVGTMAQPGTRRAIRVLRTVSTGDAARGARLSPALGSTFSLELDFPDRALDRQVGTVHLDRDSFRTEVARARTFAFLSDVEELRRRGFAQGGSLDNAIVIDGSRVLNPDGLRYRDELVRHKLLDAIGDLYLAGMPILGHFHGWRSGHAINRALLQALFDDDTAWVFDTLDPLQSAVAGYHPGVAEHADSVLA